MGKGNTSLEAYAYMKKDLERLNSSTKVNLEEYEEIMTIRPLFLVNRE